MREIRTEIEIRRPRQEVWDILADFDRYPEWNPFLRVEGDARARAKVRLTTRPPGRPRNTQTAEVLTAWEPRHLRIQGVLIQPWLFSGTHIFELKEQAGRTLFTNREEFEGVLAPVVLFLLGRNLPRGFHAMNHALKRRVESQAANRALSA